MPTNGEATISGRLDESQARAATSMITVALRRVLKHDPRFGRALDGGHRHPRPAPWCDVRSSLRRGRRAVRSADHHGQPPCAIANASNCIVTELSAI
jgi:hypothetical protein